jgi:hypothetical protein
MLSLFLFPQNVRHTPCAHQVLVKGNCRVKFLEWEHHIESIERMEGFDALEKHEAEEALRYLQTVLGDDFLLRSSAGDPCVARHPIRMLLANFAPSSRRHIARFAGYLKTLEGSQNLDKVLARLHDLTQFNHDALLIKVAAKLVGEGLRVRFEPTMPEGNNQRQPDLRLGDALTGETLFLEVVTQAPAQRERAATEISSAIIRVVYGISLDLCFSGCWFKMPSEQELVDILARIKASAVRALNERTIVLVQEEGTLALALCHRDEKASMLDPWSKERGLSCGLVGPRINTNTTVRLKRKIRDEQDQLPRDKANVIVMLATNAFLGAGGVRRVINEVEEGVIKYDHVHLVIVHGDYIDDREVPYTGYEREHRYTRRIVDGIAENDLLLVNRNSQMKLSPDLLAKFYRVF